MNHAKKSFNSRAFVSLVTLFFFSGLVVSGMMLQITDHQILSFSIVYRHVMHNIFAVVFLVFAPVHIVRNGKALKGYLSKAKNAISKELIAGLILLAIILLGCLLLSEHIAGKYTCDKNNHTCDEIRHKRDKKNHTCGF